MLDRNRNLPLRGTAHGSLECCVLVIELCTGIRGLHIRILPSSDLPPKSPSMLFPPLPELLCPCAGLPPSPLPPSHFGRLNPPLLLPPPCIHFGVSIVSIVFLTLLPKRVKKFSSSDSGSRAGLSLNLPPVVVFASCPRSAGGTHLLGAALGLDVSRLVLGESV